jgi:hypothetical protein
MKNVWIENIFKAAQAKNGGIVRRARKNVEKYGGGIDNLREAVLAREFHLVETGDQCVVLCHKGVMLVHC